MPSPASRHRFMREIACPWYVERLFDRLPDMVFSIKDRDGRYVSISEPAAQRCGLRHRDDALGLTAHELFPKPMADRYVAQDQLLFRTGRQIRDNLDLTVYNDGSQGWCLTTKEPLHDADGNIVGLACISKDLIEPTSAGMIDPAFASTIDHLVESHALPLRMEDLAQRAGLSTAQFNRRMKMIFHLPAKQYLLKLRIDHASRLLVATNLSIAEIAQNVGFADQSALARAFRLTVGFTPNQYRHYLRQARPADD